jgi:DNA topoisomerase-1
MIAMIITLILCCGFRIGNKKYEKENNSYGLTTLKLSHITCDNKKCHIIFDFIGKKGVRNTSICNNKHIYNYLSNKILTYQDSKEFNNEYIFTYNNIPINSTDVNNYLENKLNVKITTKDLRTWNANNLFTKFLTKSKDCKNPIKKALELTAIELHNTPIVCKNSYIDPKIIEYAKNQIINKN